MNTVISVRVDKDVKDSAHLVAKSAGVTLGTLINSYLRQIATTHRIELYAAEPMTPHLEGLIAEVEEELTKNRPTKRFTTSKDFMSDLEG
jgi:addiction module RelB/DinJ family antitoxin